MILRSELSFIPDDSRAIENKLMLKGEAVLKVLYITDIESGSQDTMSFNIPVSQIIDVPGIDEGTVNDISVDVMSYDISLKSEFDEGSTLLNLDARLCACVRAFEDREIVIIDDAYSTEYELETGYRTESFMRLASLCDMTQSITGNINTDGSGITRVIDLWCESISSIADNDSGKMIHQGKVIDLSKIDVDQLKKEIKTAQYKAVEIDDLKAFIEQASPLSGLIFASVE